MKLYFSAAAKDSELGKVIDKNSLKVRCYTEKLLYLLKRAGLEEKCRTAIKFSMILTMLRSWWFMQRIELGDLDPKDAPAGLGGPAGGPRMEPTPSPSASGGGNPGPHGSGNKKKRPPPEKPRKGSPPNTQNESPSFFSSENHQQHKAGAANLSGSENTPTLTFSSPASQPPEGGSGRHHNSDADNESPIARLHQSHYNPPSTPLDILSDVASRGTVVESGLIGTPNSIYNEPVKGPVLHYNNDAVNSTQHDQQQQRIFDRKPSMGNLGEAAVAAAAGGRGYMGGPTVNYYTEAAAYPRPGNNNILNNNPTGSAGPFSYSSAGSLSMAAGAGTAGGGVEGIGGDPGEGSMMDLDGGDSLGYAIEGYTEDLGLGPDWMVDDTLWAMMDGMPNPFDGWM